MQTFERGMTEPDRVEQLGEAADNLIQTKQIADQIDDPELSRIVTEALIRVGRLLAKRLGFPSGEAVEH